MPLPDVCIAPYEAGGLAPDEPLCAPAAYRVWVWSLRCGGYYLVRPVKTSNGFRVLVACRQMRAHSPLIQLQRDEQDRMSTTISKGRFYRVLYFDTEGQLASSRDDWQVTLLVSAPGCPNWRTRWNSSRFKWGVAKPKKYLSPRWRATTPAKQIEYGVGEMLADSSSDCAFAWRWAQLSEQEQSEIAFPVHQGTREQCDSLLRAVIWSDESLDQSKVWELSLGLGTFSDLQAGTWSTRTSELESDGSSYYLTPRQSRLLELVIRHFGLHLNETIAKHTVISTWRNYNDGEFLTINVPVPTNHERLEARLYLREWLQGKVPDEEILFLLGDAT